MRALMLLALPLMLTACLGTAAPSAPLKSLLLFTAYPGGSLLQEQVNGGGSGPLPTGATNGSREYLSNDGPEQVQAHYRNLATQHGWLFSAIPDGGGPERAMFNLERDRFQVTISLATDRAQLGGMAGPFSPYGPKPMIAPTPSPSPTGSPTPAPSPTPVIGPTYIRIDANFRGS